MEIDNFSKNEWREKFHFVHFFKTIYIEIILQFGCFCGMSHFHLFWASGEYIYDQGGLFLLYTKWLKRNDFMGAAVNEYDNHNNYLRIRYLFSKISIMNVQIIILMLAIITIILCVIWPYESDSYNEIKAPEFITRPWDNQGLRHIYLQLIIYNYIWSTSLESGFAADIKRFGHFQVHCSMVTNNLLYSDGS